MRRRALLGAGSALLLAPPISRAAETEVDLLLVLAADISQSMQPRDLRLQREGYAAALTAKEVTEAIGSGPTGAIAALYLEWSGMDDQRVLVPWTRLSGPRDAAVFASMLAEAPQRSGNWTSISGALAASRRLMREAPFLAERRVVDVSGDGENNHGGPVDAQRDMAVEEGIVINGLPINRQPSPRDVAGGPTALEAHYREMVAGGFGSFVLPAMGFDSFAGAIRRKLVLEIAGRVPESLLT
jgi:hypothetical protein